MNLLARLQTIILMSLFWGLLFFLTILPAPVSAQNSQNISCLVAFDWTNNLKGVHEGRSDKIYGRSKSPRFSLKLFSNQSNLPPIRTESYDDRENNSQIFEVDFSKIYQNTSYLNNDKNSLAFQLNICGNKAPNSFFLSREKCTTISSFPTCVKNGDTLTQRTIKYVEDYNAFVKTPDTGKCTVSFKLPENRLPSASIPDDSSEIIYLKDNKDIIIANTQVWKNDSSVEFSVALSGDYQINAVARSEKWIGPVAAVCPSNNTQTVVSQTSLSPTPTSTFAFSDKDDANNMLKTTPIKPSPTSTPTVTPTPTPTPTPLPTATPTPAPTATPTPTTTKTLAEYSSCLKTCQNGDFSEEKRLSCDAACGITPVPPETSAPTNTPTPTPTISTVVVTNPCPADLKDASADADGQSGVTIKDFNKIRACVKNGSTKQTMLSFSGENGWAMKVWKRDFLKK